MLHKFNTSLTTFKLVDTQSQSTKNQLITPNNKNINNPHHANHK
jgi:hypothetical protein